MGGKTAPSSDPEAERERERNTGGETKVISKYSIIKVISEGELVTAFHTIHPKTKAMSSPYAQAWIHCSSKIKRMKVKDMSLS